MSIPRSTRSRRPTYRRQLALGLMAKAGAATRRFRRNGASLVYLIHGGGAVEEIAKAVDGTMEPHFRTHTLRTISGKRFVVDSNLHFLSRTVYFNADGIPDLHPSNRTIVNWLHGGLHSLNPTLVSPAKTLQKHWHTADRIIVPNTVTRAQVLECGVDESIVRLVPNGVDTSLFKPAAGDDSKRLARSKMGIPQDAFVIGSLQRDGSDDGEPKLEKGPDLLLEAVQAIHGRRPIFLLLTASGRRYVIERLETMGVPFSHQWVEPYSDMVSVYHALDLLLITSREEGGPAGLREGMATGVPVVTTRMGLAADIVDHGVNGMVAEVGDTEGLVKSVLQLMEDQRLRAKLAGNARTTIEGLDYRKITERWRDVYAEVFR